MSSKRSKGKEMSIEEAMAEIESIIKELENGQLPLEKAIEAFSKGMDLTEFCRKKLDEVQAKVQKIIYRSNKSWDVEPFNEGGNEGLEE